MGTPTGDIVNTSMELGDLSALFENSCNQRNCLPRNEFLPNNFQQQQRNSSHIHFPILLYIFVVRCLSLFTCLQG